MNTRGLEALLSTKVQLGANMSAAAGPKGRDTSAPPMHPCAPRCSVIPVRVVCSPGCRSKAHRFVRTTTPVQRSTDIRSLRERSCEERATPFQTPAVVSLMCSRRKLPATRPLRRDSGCLGRAVVLRSWNGQLRMAFPARMEASCCAGLPVVFLGTDATTTLVARVRWERIGASGNCSRANCPLLAPCLLGTRSFVLARDERRRLSNRTRRGRARMFTCVFPRTSARALFGAGAALRRTRCAKSGLISLGSKSKMTPKRQRRARQP